MNDERAPLRIAEALAVAVQMLGRNGISEPRRDAQTLLAFVINGDRTYLIVHDDERLTAADLECFREALRRRATGEPVQYITGKQEFFGLEFEVTRGVLIPRPETELIVEAGLELIDESSPCRFCDVGTGSGCITVALLHNRPQWRGVALDISEASLAIARRNAARHTVTPRLSFIASDVFGALNETRFDFIVSNPPYIAEEELPTLQREVRDYEPRCALTPGGDGLAIVRRLLNESPARLFPGAYLIFEIGYGQEAAVRSLIDWQVWQSIEVRADLQGIGRVFVLRLKS